MMYPTGNVSNRVKPMGELAAPIQMIRHRVAAPLDRLVECLWWSRRVAPSNHFEHMLPSGGVTLLFALHESPILCRPSSGQAAIVWSGGMVHGPQSSFYVAGPKPAGSVVGVSFRPGAAAALLGVSMQDLANRHVTTAEIWGARGVDLQHRLMSLGNPAAIFKLLEKELKARLNRPLLMHPMIAQSLRLPSVDSLPARIGDLQRESGFSARHFIALFRDAVGLNPKQYFRIRRFNDAVRMIAARGDRSFVDIAAAAGYSDQAHLCREFAEMAGVTPTKYRPDAADRPLHHSAVVGAPLRRG